MDYTDKIDKGVAYLQQEHTDWLRTVDADKLDMAKAWWCILAQISNADFGCYLSHHDKSIMWAEEHGFTTFTDPETGTNYPDLTRQWKARINDLRLEAGITS